MTKTQNELETEMFADGWVRSPNTPTEWYASYAGKLAPASPFELRVTDKIWMVARKYGTFGDDGIFAVMGFNGVAELNAYLARHGEKQGISTPGNNVWD